MNHNRLKANFSLLIKIIFNHAIQLFQALLFIRKKILDNPNRILVYRIGQIGDVVCSIPAMIAIRSRFPRAHIALLTSPVRRDLPGAKELISKAAFLDEMIVYYHDEIENWSGIFELMKKLRNNRYDLFIELPNDLATLRMLIRDMLFARVIGCNKAIGFRLNTVQIFLKQQAKYLQSAGEVARLVSMLADEGISNREVIFRLPIEKNDIQFIDAIFEEYAVMPGDLCIAMVPGAKRPTNRWLKERFAMVGRALIDQYDAKIWLTGGRNDEQLADWIAQEIGYGAISLAGKTSLLQSAELVKRCHLLISNDTGTMHLAAAMGRPVVAIFSARDFPNKWYPYGNSHVVLRKSLDCELCFKEQCEHLTCLKLISVPDVLDACNKILSQIFRQAENAARLAGGI